MISDNELLRRYARYSDQAAFAEFVRRRIDLVYSIAVRQCGGDRHLAEDVVQQVFADSARKAQALAAHTVLSGWLCRATRFAAGAAVRTERRRRARETIAMHDTEPSAFPAADPEHLRSLLDEVLSELSEAERDAVALRYLEHRSFSDIATILRTSDDAARMRVNRALEKIQSDLASRGITSTASALAIVIEQQGALAAPAQLTAAVLALHPVSILSGAKAAGLVLVMVSAVVVVGIWRFNLREGDRHASPTVTTTPHARTVPTSRPSPASVPSATPVPSPVRMARELDPPLSMPAASPIRQSVIHKTTVQLFGSIRNPGLIAWKEGMTVSQAIVAADGLTPMGDANRIKVSRYDKDRGAQTLTLSQADLNKFVLNAGDVVYVPERIL